MIAYFDSSAVIPLLIGEPSSATCARVWNEAARSITTSPAGGDIVRYRRRCRD